MLVDTGVWSSALRRGDKLLNPEREKLRRVGSARVAEIIGPVRQEILSAVRDQAQFVPLETHLAAFPDVPLLDAGLRDGPAFFQPLPIQGNPGFEHRLPSLRGRGPMRFGDLYHAPGLSALCAVPAHCPARDLNERGLDRSVWM